LLRSPSTKEQAVDDGNVTHYGSLQTEECYPFGNGRRSDAVTPADEYDAVL